MDSKSISKAIGKQIQSARLFKGITQEQLSEACHVSPNHISSIENGYSNCSMSLIISICIALDISPNFLFSDFIDNENNSLDLIDKDVIITYLKLRPENKDFINSTISHIYNIQKHK